MTRTSKSALSLTLGIVFYASHAMSAQVEPDDYPSGTDISNAVSGVTLSTASGGGVSAFGGACPFTSTGANVFAPNSDLVCDGWDGMNLPPLSDPYDPNALDKANATMEAAFSPLVSSVSIDVVPDDSDDPFSAAIYDNAGNLLDEVRYPGPAVAGAVTTISFSRPSADIALLVVAGEDSANVTLDNLQFDTVPLAPRVQEPVPVMGAVGLLLTALGLGFAGLLGLRRRR